MLGDRIQWIQWSTSGRPGLEFYSVRRVVVYGSVCTLIQNAKENISVPVPDSYWSWTLDNIFRGMSMMAWINMVFLNMVQSYHHHNVSDYGMD